MAQITTDKYQVKFMSKLADPEISDGKWHENYFDNNGEGFTLEDAQVLTRELANSEYAYNKNIRILHLGAE